MLINFFILVLSVADVNFAMTLINLNIFQFKIIFQQLIMKQIYYFYVIQQNRLQPNNNMKKPLWNLVQLVCKLLYICKYWLVHHDNSL